MVIDLKQCVELLKENDNFLVLSHEHPDGDTLGSAFALMAALKKIGKKRAFKCSDEVTRENEWTGKVGLMYLSDMKYANGWLYTSGKGVSQAWTISPDSRSSYASFVRYAYSSSAGGHASYSSGVWPSVYLNSNVQIIGAGENIGTSTNPYVLSMSSSETTTEYTIVLNPDGGSVTPSE